MTDELTDFLLRNHACSEVLARLDATGAATPEEMGEPMITENTEGENG